MPTTLKILGQFAPGATTEETLYTVPGSTTAVVSTVVVSNRSATAATFRISASITGAATVTKDYLAYDVPLGGNETIAFTLGITIGATDRIRVYASTANLSFGAFGQENS